MAAKERKARKGCCPHGAVRVVCQVLRALCVLLWLDSPVLAGDKNGVGLEKISLPSGPGSIEGLGDAFEPQLNTGTSSYSVKIASPPGVAGLQPNVVLRYNSGAGNGHFGIAWSDGLMAIQRQTEKGLPVYGGNDKFTMGGEELVPLSDGSYRTENESAFQRVRPTGSGWEVTDKKGTRWLLGTSTLAQNPSRLVRPGGSSFGDTFKWCADTVIDVNGNQMEFRYQTFADSPGDVYCTEIRYSIFGGTYHSIVFDYEPRADAFSSFLSGFEVRTGRRCWQIRVVSAATLVRRYGLGYTLPANDPVEIIAPTDAGAQFSLLRQVTQFDKGGTSANYLPPLRLGYTRFDAANAVQGGFANPMPYSLANANLALADLNCDGLPDFLYTDPLNGQHSVIYNEGVGRFSAEYQLAGVPTGTSLSNSTTQLTDYDGDGRIDLVQKAGGTGGTFSYFPNSTRPSGNDDTHPAWGAEVPFVTPYPPFDFSDPSVRTLDLNGDKRIDFMRTTSAGFIYYYNRGDRWEEDGLYLFGEPQMGDIAYADALEFAEAGQSSVRVKLADMNGDRLLDLVRINEFGTHLEVTYWPNKGRGYWGTRHEMTGDIDLSVVPIEDAFVMDLNGDGLSDIVAVAVDHVSYWVNLGNDTFSRRLEVANTPTYIRGQTVLRQADINGNGSTDFLWENFSPQTGGYQIQYVDFTGGVRPNLLRVIDNGIGLQTFIEYKTSTNFYQAARRGGNSWRTRLPVPVQVVSRITKRFGLNLDSAPGIDSYITEFAYHDGYYDGFEKEFRGFAFARKIEVGDDRQGATEVNSPTLITRMFFHTGAPDNLDNDGDGQTDEFNAIAGYEEEALKGKVLATETTALTGEGNGLDDDNDGFVDEADEGPFAGQTAANSNVFTRETNNWQLKTIHDASGGFTEPTVSLPFRTMNGQKVTFPFVADMTKEVIERSPALATTIATHTDVDHFGGTVFQQDFGVTSGGPLSTDDERYTTTQYAHRPDLWIVGLPSVITQTDETGAFVSKTVNTYDDLSVGSVGPRGLLTGVAKFINASQSVLTATHYDAFGNPDRVRDPDYGSAPGHERRYSYDATFHTYVEQEQIDTGSTTLTASATYDFGGGVLTTAHDFNGNLSTFQYDSFFRLVGVVKPGDTAGAPTSVYEYHPGDTVRKLVYDYDASGNLSLSTSGATLVLSSVAVKSREIAGGGTFDVFQITDGAGHKLGTIEEGATAGQWIYKNVKRYTSRGAERDSFLPFTGGSPQFVDPPPDGDRTTMFYDAPGRTVRSVMPPEIVGGPRRESQTQYLPLKTILSDEEDTTAGSPHFGTPHVQYKDGLDRLIGVDELNGGQTWPTRYAYDLLDNLTRITDSQNNVKTMSYDGLKRLTAMDDPDRGVMGYTYDAASNLTETVDAKGQHIVMTYDGANRLKTEDYLDASGLAPDVTYFYDTPATVSVGDGTSATSTNVAGKLVSVTDLSGAEYLSYDARGRTAWKVKRIPDPVSGALASYQCAYAYDSLDRLTRNTYPDGDFADYAYNTRNLPQSITGGPGGIITSMAYRPSGQLDNIHHGNGVATTYAYDPRLRLRSLNTQHSTLNTQLVSFSYTFDGASNITRIDDNRPAGTIPANDPRRNTQVFAYDDLYRLTQVQYPATSGQIAYGYDRIGNMLSQTSNIAHDENGLSVTNLGTMSYGGTAGASSRQGRDGGQPGPHALTAASVGGRSYPYDANGNMQTIDGLACTWDFKDRLTAVENAQMRAEYTYDYTDRRITKRVFPKTNGVASTKPDVTLYVDRTFELREDGAPVKYVWNGDTRVARVTANLNATQRVQRFTLQPGRNLIALAVTLTDGTAQLLTAPVQQVYRQGPGLGQYSAILPNEAIPAGTILRVQASAAGTLAVRGTWTAAVAATYPAGRQWIANSRFEPLDVAARLPADAPLWFFDAATQDWRHRFLAPLASAGNHPSRLAPGEATFAATTAPFTLSAPDPTLEIRYYHQDHLGSSSVMSDANGQLVSESAYYPYGHPRQEDQPRGVQESYGFTQKEKDGESGLAYFEARFLVSRLSRFSRPDPALCISPDSRVSDPQALNLYAYATNHPITRTDPTGLLDWDMVLSGGKDVAVGAISMSIGVVIAGGGIAAITTGVGAPVGAFASVNGTLLVAGGAATAGLGLVEAMEGFASQPKSNQGGKYAEATKVVSVASSPSKATGAAVQYGAEQGGASKRTATNLGIAAETAVNLGAAAKTIADGMKNVGTAEGTVEIAKGVAAGSKAIAEQIPAIGNANSGPPKLEGKSR